MKERLGLDKIIPETYKGVKCPVFPVEGNNRPNSRLVLELIKYGNYFSRFGWAPEYKIEGSDKKGSSGNLGFRDEKGIVVTATATDLGKLVPDDLMRVVNVNYGTDPPTILYEKSGDRKPTSEFLAYDRIFSDRKDISVILHAHNALTTERAQWLEHYSPDLVARTDKPKPYGTKDLADSLGAKLTSKTRYIIANGHGFFSLGRNVSEAFIYAAEMHLSALVLKIYSEIVENESVSKGLERLHLDGLVAAGSDALAEPIMALAGSIGGKVLDGFSSIKTKLLRKTA